MKPSDSFLDAVPPAEPADSSLEDIPSAADTGASSHVLGSALQLSESSVKLWAMTAAEAAAAAVLSPLSRAFAPDLGTLSSVPLLDSIVQPTDAPAKLWTTTLEEAAAAAVLSMAYFPKLGALSPVPLLDPVVQPTGDSIAKQPLQGLDSTGEQAASNVESLNTATQRQNGLKVCTTAQWCSNGMQQPDL